MASVLVSAQPGAVRSTVINAVSAVAVMSRAVSLEVQEMVHAIVMPKQWQVGAGLKSAHARRFSSGLSHTFKPGIACNPIVLLYELQQSSVSALSDTIQGIFPTAK